MGSSLYILAFALTILTAARAQGLSNSTLCQTVVPSLDCSLAQAKKLCGSDGVTYATGCDFAKAHCLDLDIKIDYQGPCDCQPAKADPVCVTLLARVCPQDSFPVCASDGNSYINLCAYEQVKCLKPTLRLQSLGVCPTIPPSTTIPTTTTTISILEVICQSLDTIACQSSGPEVCASDGLTYANACELEKANCKSDAGITLVKEGPC